MTGRAFSIAAAELSDTRSAIESNSIPVPFCGCWIWTGAAHHTRGYGIICRRRWPQKNVFAHRASYAAFKGEIPAGFVVMHTCDTPACVNPDHLIVGSTADNLGDMARKGRSTLGRSNRRVLTPQIVIACRESGLTVAEFARRNNVPYPALAAAIRGETYAWVA